MVLLVHENLGTVRSTACCTWLPGNRYPKATLYSGVSQVKWSK